MQIRWDFGRPFQQDSRFKISGTGTELSFVWFIQKLMKRFQMISREAIKKVEKSNCSGVDMNQKWELEEA